MPATPETLNEVLDLLREAVENADIDGFLKLYKEHQAVRLTTTDARFTGVVTRLFEPMVLRELAAGRVAPETVGRLWRATYQTCPPLANADLLRELNAHAQGASEEIKGKWVLPDTSAAPSEGLSADITRPGRTSASRLSAPGSALPAIIRLERQVNMGASFVMGEFRESAGLSPRRSLARSPQELAFYQAVRMFWPQLHIQCNVPLDNFMEFPPGPDMTDQLLTFMRFSRVDILMCTDELDPVAGFELDSSFHDDPVQQENDARKRMLFEMAGITLISIRDASPQTVTADDFYDFLASDERLGNIRPPRIRTRRPPHQKLVPVSP